MPALLPFIPAARQTFARARKLLADRPHTAHSHAQGATGGVCGFLRAGSRGTGAPMLSQFSACPSKHMHAPARMMLNNCVEIYLTLQSSLRLKL